MADLYRTDWRIYLCSRITIANWIAWIIGGISLIATHGEPWVFIMATTVMIAVNQAIFIRARQVGERHG